MSIAAWIGARALAALAIHATRYDHVVAELLHTHPSRVSDILVA